ncbi:MAG TPA: NAD(P)-dependent glycerol-3-phosphate dehydrogenase, partial [Nannocystis exedens]|nr:NAD(P)-dependent glycerol-3-phosphate dehydrogenase [Nannocystis exedens]
MAQVPRKRSWPANWILPSPIESTGSPVFPRRSRPRWSLLPAPVIGLMRQPKVEVMWGMSVGQLRCGRGLRASSPSSVRGSVGPVGSCLGVGRGVVRGFVSASPQARARAQARAQVSIRRGLLSRAIVIAASGAYQRRTRARGRSRPKGSAWCTKRVPMTASSSDSSSVVTVLGAGSWGTALALHAAREGLETRLWTRSAEHCAAMRADRRNRRYLPDAEFGEHLMVTDDLDVALAGADLVILAIPSHGMREAVVRVAAALARLEAQGRAIAPMYLIAAKGVEVDSLKTMADVLADELPASDHRRIAVLGGPSFAAEVAAGQPTAVVIASAAREVAETIQCLLSGECLRVYVSDDVLGVELGGAFKNVIALAAGVCDGAGLGQNTRAALITRGLAEITRISLALGAHPATLAGLAGLGDLVL